MTDGPDVAIYDALPGGAELVRWFGEVPTFHDAEILSLHLHHKRPSILRLRGWILKTGSDGFFEMYNEAVVTFTMESVMDLQLDGFSAQNVIGGLVLRFAPTRPDRRPYLSLDPLPEDIEIELEDCFGLSGLIRARSVEIAFVPGKPHAQDA